MNMKIRKASVRMRSTPKLLSDSNFENPFPKWAGAYSTQAISEKGQSA
jgi:hypothetical protein